MKRKFNAWATGGIMVGFGLFAGCAPAPVAHRWESGPAIAAALSDAGMPADYCALVTNPMYVSSLNPPSTVGRSTCYHGGAILARCTTLRTSNTAATSACSSGPREVILKWADGRRTTWTRNFGSVRSGVV